MKKWYQKTWVIILFLIIFFPIGLVLTWLSKWNKCVKMAVTALFVLVFVIGSSNNVNNEQTSSQVEDVIPATEEIVSETEEESEEEVPEKTPEEIEIEYKTSCEVFDYKDLSRNPSNYENKQTVITGKVIQVSENAFGTVTLRVATKEAEYLGYTDDIYMVTYKQVESNRMLEDDIVTIWGMCEGVTTYTSVLGGKITVPSVKMEYYAINE